MISATNEPTGVKKDALEFEALPDYAAYLLKEKLDEFITAGLEFSTEEDLPILKHLAAFSREQLMEMAKVGNTDLLSCLAANKAKDYIQRTMKAWTDNRLVVIDRDEIAAEDITVGAFVRRKIFRHFLKEYTHDESRFSKIMEELDKFTTQTELLSYNAFITLQQEKLSKINAELSLRESQLLEAQELAEMGSFFWDLTDPEASQYTPQVNKIFGLELMAGLDSFIKNVHPGDREDFQEAIDRAIVNDGIFECEYRYIRNGEERKIWSRGIVQFDNGKATAMKGTVMDVTKKHRMLEQLTGLNASLALKNTQLERINAELESFNYVASHDLQEPLRKIQTYSGRLSEHPEKLPGNLMDYIEKINSSSMRMQHLIEDLLEFSQLTSPSDAFEDTDLDEALDEARRSLSEQVEQSGAVIASGDLPKVNVVPFQFAQLFTNIIGNAIKYKKATTAPFIQLRSETVTAVNPETHLEGKYVRITISDNGIGFDDEYAERIFDLFKRLHAKEKYSGTGIGLSICKKIVHNHNGFITAEGKPGEGSTFHIHLPAERLLN